MERTKKRREIVVGQVCIGQGNRAVRARSSQEAHDVARQLEGSSAVGCSEIGEANDLSDVLDTMLRSASSTNGKVASIAFLALIELSL